MKTETWTIFGAGGLINDFIDAIESNDQHAEYLVLNIELDRKILQKLPASIKTLKLEDFEPATDCYFFGFADPNKLALLESLKKFDLNYENLIHKFSYVPRNVKMGKGNFIGAGVVLATKVQLGDFNYINRSASLGHDTQIAHFNQFGPGCTIAGNCRIGSRNNFYMRSVIVNDLEIRDAIKVGAGGVVTKNILEPGTYAGVPARRLP
jgi:sugar O-acyltransferase (sialic acid O-acetyltransferase NeuD family)